MYNYIQVCVCVWLPGGGCNAIDHEVNGLGSTQLDPLSQHVHELGNWRQQKTTTIT